MSLRSFREIPGIQRYPTNPREWTHWVNEVGKWLASQESVDDAARTSAYAVSVPSSFVWNADGAGSYAGITDTTENIVTTFYDQAGTQVAQRTLLGTINTGTGDITVTAVSDTASTGYSTAYVLTDDGTGSVLATITLTLPDGSMKDHTISWNSLDPSTAGGTPATGGGK